MLVLVLGATGGIYLGVNRQHHYQTVDNGRVIAFDAQLAEFDQAPIDSANAKRQAAISAAEAKAAAAAAAAAAQAKKAQDVARRDQAASRSQTRTTYGPVPASCKAYEGNRALGCALLLDAGFGLEQMPCLDKLFTKESGWNHKARNQSSGAYGIPQALPASKMATYGSDYLTNPVPQIKWGLNYIERRYDTPCGAWSFWQSHNWY